jgi:hypothetical protein
MAPYLLPHISRVRALDGNWQELDLSFDGRHYYAQAKVYDEGSEYGINEGRVSKLGIRLCETKEYVYNYDRGQDIETPAGLLLADHICKYFA